MTLLDPRSIRRLAAELGLRPSKQRGQNFVHDANTVRRIVAAAGVAPGQVVLEVGPGLGSLTLGLLEAGAEVVAVEIEPCLARRLPRTVAELMPEAGRRLHVVEGDALKLAPAGESPEAASPGADAQGRGRPDGNPELVDVGAGPADEAREAATPARGGQAAWPLPELLVANLPYNVSVPVILHLLEKFDTIQGGLVMVQSEVADRLVAGPGSKVYGAPSAKLAWYADATRVGGVPPTVFWPAPNVDSGLVSFRRHPEGLSGGSQSGDSRVAGRGGEDSAGEGGSLGNGAAAPARERVFAVVDAAFGQRRKMLRQALSGLFGSSSAAAEALAGAGVDPQARGERLSIADFARVAARLP
ncbi:MAG: 16S rRNA (adenine(1518)-N(6)/adenine(1519)-N(6))-dimethyltransferase [Propionibacteriaceae bacterium]|jgi:16S rRNA (adenine1518-N6/adenine1519-N6)-dimethyltransferase|nr:16S rRNA (adenine(1518)-N(6)/adenine(1519)-N(6))-dimethyltransferase [Propionibacteriaceae bacterium]